MAKLDELDPRWIVEFRPDATNVNNWHWVEKNAFEWSKKKLTELLVGTEVIDEDVGRCVVTELSELEGEATANNRKGKLIFLIDLTMKGKWEGTLKGDTSTYKGKFTIIDFDDVETENLNFDVEANLKSNDNAHKLREVFRKRANDALVERLKIYLSELRSEYSQNLILPTKESDAAQPKDVKSSKTPVDQKLTKLSLSKSPKLSSKSSVAISTKTLEIEELFRCRPEEAYRAFTEPQMLRAVFNGAVEMDEPVAAGSLFKFYGGNISGRFTELVPFTRVKQQWRMQAWPESHHSDVSIEFFDKGIDGQTKITLRQTGVPSSDFESTEMGWQRNILERMKDVFGFGARLR